MKQSSGYQIQIINLCIYSLINSSTIINFCFILKLTSFSSRNLWSHRSIIVCLKGEYFFCVPQWSKLYHVLAVSQLMCELTCCVALITMSRSLHCSIVPEGLGISTVPFDISQGLKFSYVASMQSFNYLITIFQFCPSFESFSDSKSLPLTFGFSGGIGNKFSFFRNFTKLKVKWFLWRKGALPLSPTMALAWTAYKAPQHPQISSWLGKLVMY